MPKRKSRAKPCDWKRVTTDSSDGHQHSVNPVDFSTSLDLNKETVSTQKQPASLNREQFDEVTRPVIAAMSSRTETSHPQNEMTQDASANYPGTDILPTIAISYNQKSHVQS